MWDYLNSCFSTNGFMPHGHCFLWSPGLLIGNIIAELLIAAAYFSIPIALWCIARKRKDFEFDTAFMMFGLFIISCGFTHLFSLWNIWHLDYWGEMVLKLFTGLISMATAIMLWPLIPKILAIPSTKQLTAINIDLRNEVAERNIIEHKLRLLNDELEAHSMNLEKSNKEIETFSYSISHDLRAPLRAIDGYSHMLANRLKDNAADEESIRLLGVIRSGTKKMSRLIDDILSFSRIGHQDLNCTNIDIDALIQSIWQDILPLHADRIVCLDVKPMPPIVGDAVMFRQVYMNLLVNALKFTGTQAKAIIEVGAIKEAKETVYYVKDNGVGFDQTYVGKLFGMFQRLHAISEFEGTGIGLAIIKVIIERHGGRVWAEGEVDKGATIFFVLPVRGNRAK